MQQQEEEAKRASQFRARPFDLSRYRDVGVRRASIAHTHSRRSTPSHGAAAASPVAPTREQRDMRRRDALDSRFLAGDERRERVNTAKAERAVCLSTLQTPPPPSPHTPAACEPLARGQDEQRALSGGASVTAGARARGGGAPKEAAHLPCASYAQVRGAACTRSPTPLERGRRRGRRRTGDAAAGGARGPRRLADPDAGARAAGGLDGCGAARVGQPAVRLATPEKEGTFEA